MRRRYLFDVVSRVPPHDEHQDAELSATLDSCARGRAPPRGSALQHKNRIEVDLTKYESVRGCLWKLIAVARKNQWQLSLSEGKRVFVVINRHLDGVFAASDCSSAVLFSFHKGMQCRWLHASDNLAERLICFLYIASGSSL